MQWKLPLRRLRSLYQEKVRPIQYRIITSYSYGYKKVFEKDGKKSSEKKVRKFEFETVEHQSFG